MSFAENLQKLRKSKGLSQEELAGALNVSRQAIGKWENGTTYPDIENLIVLSDLFKIPIDKLVRKEENCDIKFFEGNKWNEDIINFLIRAKRATYAGNGAEVDSCRKNSHDLAYMEEGLYYYDTYIGGERFSGEEAVWNKELPIWCMNYTGRVIGEGFLGEFLKEALSAVNKKKPFRGPEFFQKGEYSYHCKVTGDFEWFKGYEEIIYNGSAIYECYFHGGLVK